MKNLLTLGALLLCSVSAFSATLFHPTYFYFAEDDAPTTLGLIKWEKFADGSRSTSWPNNIPGQGESSSIYQVFGSPQPQQRGFQMGVAYTGDVESESEIPLTRHLVLTLNLSTAVNLVGQEFSSIFDGWNEDDLIDAAIRVGITGEEADPAAFETAINLLDSFADYTQFASYDGLPFWFDMTSVESEFAGVMFSQGQIIYNGFSTVTAITTPDPDPNAVPEPATYACVAVLLTGLAYRARRRQSGS
jgi:hypothetical protein